MITSPLPCCAVRFAVPCCDAARSFEYDEVGGRLQEFEFEGTVSSSRRLAVCSGEMRRVNALPVDQNGWSARA